MDIAEVSMRLASENTMRSFGIGMIRKALDTQEQMGAMLGQMFAAIPAAPDVGQGTRVDIRI